MVSILVCSNNAFEEQLGFHKVLLGKLAEGVKRFLFFRILVSVLAKLDDMTCKGSGLGIGAASSLSDKLIENGAVNFNQVVLVVAALGASCYVARVCAVLKLAVLTERINICYRYNIRRSSNENKLCRIHGEANRGVVASFWIVLDKVR